MGSLQVWHAATAKETGVMLVYLSIGICLFSVVIRMFYFFLFDQKKYFDLICDLDADFQNTKNNSTPQENAIIKAYNTYAYRLSSFLVRTTQCSLFLIILVHLWKANFNPIKTLGVSLKNYFYNSIEKCLHFSSQCFL